MMGAAAFLMAEFLGVPYWDVVLRGFGFTFIYYISIGVSIYLLSVRLLPPGPIDKPQVPLYQKLTTAIFLGSVAYLVVLIGFLARANCLERSSPRAGCSGCWSRFSSISNTCARTLARGRDAVSPASGAGSKRMPR